MTTTLELAAPADAVQIHDIYASYCATPISFEWGPPSVDEMRQRILKIAGKYPWLVCKVGGQVVGYAYAGPHRERAAYRWSVDVSAYVHPLRKRQGVGRALYTTLFKLLILQGFITAYAGIALPNPASVGLHEAMGFEPVGVYRQVGFKAGSWHDVGWYQHLLQPPPAQPDTPKHLDEVRQTEAWIAALHAGVTILRG